MVLGVLNQAFDVLVLRYGVQKRVYCNVSTHRPPRPGLGTSRQPKAQLWAAEGHLLGRECQGPYGFCSQLSLPSQTHPTVSTAHCFHPRVPHPLPGSPPYSSGTWGEAWRMGAQAGLLAVLTCPGEYKPWW